MTRTATTTPLLNGLAAGLLAAFLTLFGCAQRPYESPQPQDVISNADTTPIPTRFVKPSATATYQPSEDTTTSNAPAGSPTTPESSLIPTKPTAQCHEDPRKALDDFLSYLHTGQYQEAAELYHRQPNSSGYPNERPFPTDATKEERQNIEARGLAEFCHGYRTCMDHRIVGEETIPTGFLFIVQFYDEAGNPFQFSRPFVDIGGKTSYESVGPDFRFTVRRINGCYKSLHVPPITP